MPELSDGEEAWEEEEEEEGADTEGPRTRCLFCDRWGGEGSPPRRAEGHREARSYPRSPPGKGGGGRGPGLGLREAACRKIKYYIVCNSALGLSWSSMRRLEGRKFC